MSSQRRPQLAQRRRRVIYAHGLGGTGGGSKTASAASRAARRPTAAYGARVHRRLRARWFGLVPVRRRSLTAAISITTGLATLLTLGHWAASYWAPLAYTPDLARPLRLDRPDSFGTWLGTLLLFSAAGAAFLIYQLRRYRSDDYQGRYRIWRPVILLLAVACLDSVVGLVGWGGHLLDACLGERKALTGGDWIRLLLAIGGAALCLRLLAEVWKSRVATLSIGVAAATLAYPALVHWKIMEVTSPLTSTFHSAAPLWARTAIWVAMLAYLRLLYRDVKQIDAHDRLADRVRNLKLVRLWNAEPHDEDLQEDETKPKKRTPKSPAAPSPKRKAKPAASRPVESDEDAEEVIEAETRPRRRWFGLRKPAPHLDSEESRDDDSDDRSDPQDAGDSDRQDADDARPAKRSWRSRFSRRRQPADLPEDAQQEETAEQEDAESQEAADSQAPKRSWRSRFSLRRKPKGSQPTDDQEEQTEPTADLKQQDDDKEKPTPRKRRFGFGLRARNNATNESESVSDEAAETDEPVPRRRAAAAKPAAEHDDEHNDDEDNHGEQDLDPDSIDWGSLSKAERRRLRRELKRQGKAA